MPQTVYLLPVVQPVYRLPPFLYLRMIILSWIKRAVKLYCNADPSIAAVRSFEELAVQNGRHSIIKDAKKYAEALDLQLWFNFPNPVAVADGKEVEAEKVKQAI